MLKEEITFVLQGPVFPTTKYAVEKIRSHFSASKIILSTWRGENTDDINADSILYNEDPGATIVKYNRKGVPHTVNVNRQIVSSINGLKCVETKYAVKMRTDNILHDDGFINHFDAYIKRDEAFSLFSRRIIASNFFAKEYTQGLSVPFFVSDFFHFGLTRDLVDLWDVSLFDDYQFNDALKGKLQHDNLPYRQHHVEQKLWLKFINKHRTVTLNDKFGDRVLRRLSYDLLVNNIIILDPKELRLEVPKRLEQNNDFPYEFYTHSRWNYHYGRYFNMPVKVSNSRKVKWVLASVYRFIRQGLYTKLKNTMMG